MKPDKSKQHWNSRDMTKTSDDSCCPLTSNPRLRIAVDSQIASIKDRFPKGVAQPALRALFRAGFKKLEELTKISQEELLSMHGVGPKAVRSIREGLVAKGLDFRK